MTVSTRRIREAVRGSLGVAAETFYPAYVETVRIFNVNIADWSVDCISELGSKRYFDVQVSSPYFHFMNGEGIYAMPEVGALAWMCIPSSGKMAQGFLMGFQSPFDEDNENYQSGRQSLNPGDVMLRTRDENFLILRRGGVIQIGATPIAQRIYVPIRNFIQDFCENYKLSTFGGEMFWETQRDDQTVDGEAPTKFYLKSKQKANDPQHIAELTMGSHGEGNPLTIDLTVWTDGTDNRENMVRLQITNEGNVVWDIKKDWTQNITGKYSVSADGDASLNTKGNLNLVGQLNTTLEAAKGNLSLSGAVNSDLTAGAIATIEAPVIKHGVGAVSPAVKGLELAAALTVFAQAGEKATNVPLLAPLKPVFIALAAAVPTIISTKNFVE